LLILIGAWMVLAPPVRLPAQEPILHFGFNQSLDGTVGGAVTQAKPGPGASFVRSVNGYGLQSRPHQIAATIPITRSMIPSSGTFVVWFRADERIGPDSAGGSITLVDGAGMRIRLERRPNLVALDVRIGSDGRGAMEGDALFSHFRKDVWYQMALVWDFPTMQMDFYLNGVLQQDLRPRMTSPDRVAEEPEFLALTKSVISLAIDAPTLFGTAFTAEEIDTTANGIRMPGLQGEGRTIFDGGIDLSRYKLELIYDADFREPLRVRNELALIEGGFRREPSQETEWVLEGDGKVWTQDGSLLIETTGSRNAGHLVLWSTRRFPDDILIEFEMEPEDIGRGLAILFFATRPIERPDGSIFASPLPLRDGLFIRYHSGALNGYHVSYWSGGRRTVNLRKNAGFVLATCGDDVAASTGATPHRLRVLKAGRKIEVEADGRLALRYWDTAASNAVWSDGYVGLRQMGDTHRMRYGSFKVYQLK
jgi:hypothetical protein